MFAAKTPLFTPTRPAISAIGTGSNGTGSSRSWTHIFGPNDNCLIIGWAGTGGTVANINFTIGGNPYNGSGWSQNGGAGVYAGLVYYIPSGTNPALPVGSQTVAITYSSSVYWAVDSLSFSGVTKVNGPFSSTSTSVSMNTPTANAGKAGSIIVGQLASNGTGTFSGYNGNTAYSKGYSGGVNYPGFLGYAPVTNPNTSYTSACSTSAGGSVGNLGVWVD